MKGFFIFQAGQVLSCRLTILVALVPVLTNAQLIPAISNFNPISGAVGAGINISGTNFSPVASSNIVFFGAVRAAVSSASSTNLSVSVPTGATYAPITVTVNGLTAWADRAFLVTYPGNGQFDASSLAPRLDLAADTSPGQTVIADMDGDGKPDLIILNGDRPSVSIFRNISTNGSLTANSFAPRLDLPVNAVMTQGGGMTVADLDGDGRPDIIAISVSTSKVSIFQNFCSPGSIASNSFGAQVDLPVTGGPTSVAVRDLDGDGRPEVATANYASNTVSILRNIGAGGIVTTNSFAPQVDYTVNTGAHCVSFADLEGDGKPDLVSVNYNDSSGMMSVLQNNSTPGNLSFAAKVDFSCLPDCIDVRPCDLDGDGKLDLVVTEGAYGQAISVFRNTSTAGGITTNSLAPRVDFAVGAWAHTVAFGDLDGDGKPDVAVACELPSQLSIFKNTSSPGSFTTSSFAPRVDFSTGWNAWGVAMGDLDGDGRPDIVFGNQYDGIISIYQNQVPFGGPPVFTSQPQSSTNAVGSTAVLAANVIGTAPISCQWLFNGTPLTDNGRISGATNSTLIISNLQTNDTGNYQLLATNVFGSTNSSMVFLDAVYVLVPPAITQQPTNQNVIGGSNIGLSVTVTGDIPLYYQWYLDGTVLADNGRISGSTSGTLTISNAQVADIGNYNVIITNWAGSVTSVTAVVTVLLPPLITTQPVGRSVPPGLPTIITASVSGTALNYQWQLNGADIPGATNASYFIAAVGTNDLGFYHLVATNALNVAVSADAQLTFGPVAAWGRNTSGECLPPPGLSNVIAVAGNVGASFAVRADGTIAAWGGGASTNIPASASNVVAIAAPGSTANYALRNDGTIIGWNGISVPALSNIVSVAAGYNFGYALRAEGTLTNWGSIPTPGFPAGLNQLTAIACGFNNAVALRNDGTVVVSGSGVVTNVPGGLDNVVAIAAGYSYAMALKANGTVVAWGSGTGTNLPAGVTNIAAISAGNYSGENFGLAIRSNGTVVVWGDNPYAETSPPAALSNLVSIAGAAAAYHGLALVNDGSPVILHPPVGLTTYTGRDVTLRGDAAGAQPLTYQWLLNGTNISGATNPCLVLSNVQSGNAGNYQLFVSNAVNTALSLPAPLTVISNNALVFLSQPAGQTNYQGSKVSLGVAVLGNGPLRYQWYFSRTNSGYTPVAGATNNTLTLDPALAVHTGNYYVVVSNQFNFITSTTANLQVLFAKIWGYLPTDPPFNLTNAVAIAVGNPGGATKSGHYLALRSDGKILAWGTSTYGETNTAALSNSIVTAIAAGYMDSLALRSDGTVYAWGYSIYGETNVPAGLNSVVAIACGIEHDLALRSDGTVVAWGYGSYGQTNVPASATNVIAIAGGYLHSLALRADGTAVAWGYNSYGQTNVPVSASNVIAIAAGDYHCLALRANGTVVGWGNNGSGQTTIPTGLSNVVAISAAVNHSTALRSDGTVVTWGVYYTSSATAPSDLANVIQIASGGDRDAGMFGTRAPYVTIQPVSRTAFKSATNVLLAAKVAGVQPVTYQWRYNGANLSGATNDTLTLTNLQFAQAGAYQLVASNAYGVVLSKPAKVMVTLPLGEALDTTNRTWTTSGNALWYGQTNVTHDGVDAARSGEIGSSQETILQTIVATNGPGHCTFWWKVSSEEYFDILEFRVNGVTQTSISGEVDWQSNSIGIPTGTNTLQWRYSKDATYGGGLDAGWVDQFSFIADPPVITGQPVSQTVNMGTNVQFRVTATGYQPFFIQWWQNGTNAIGTGSTLTLFNVGRAQNGLYSAVVSNVGGSTLSSNATLKVLVPQKLGPPVLLPDGTLQLSSGDADGGLLSASDLANFEAWASTNLTDWVTIPGALSLTNGMLLLQDGATANWPQRFYRIIEH